MGFMTNSSEVIYLDDVVPDPAYDNGTFTGFYLSGRGSISSPKFLQDDIDVIRYYSSALIASEVLADFNAGPTLGPRRSINRRNHICGLMRQPV
jgi:hypothetical protein